MAAIVGGGVLDAPQVSSPSRVICRAASPLAAVAVCDGGKCPGGMNPSPTNGRRVGGNACRGEPYSGKTKKTRRPLPRLVFFKKKEKNRTSRRRLNANGTTPLQVIPSLRIRQGALVFFLFSCRSEALAFDVLIVHYFCRICKMRTCTTCYIHTTLFCIVCTIVHG